MTKSTSSFATSIVLVLVHNKCHHNGGSLIDLRKYFPVSNGLYLSGTGGFDLII